MDLGRGCRNVGQCDNTHGEIQELTMNCHWVDEGTTSGFIVVNFCPCCAACGILVPQPGTDPTPPAMECGVLTTGLLGKSLGLL